MGRFPGIPSLAPVVLMRRSGKQAMMLQCSTSAEATMCGERLTSSRLKTWQGQHRRSLIIGRVQVRLRHKQRLTQKACALQVSLYSRRGVEPRWEHLCDSIIIQTLFNYHTIKLCVACRALLNKSLKSALAVA